MIDQSELSRWVLALRLCGFTLAEILDVTGTDSETAQQLLADNGSTNATGVYAALWTSRLKLRLYDYIPVRSDEIAKQTFAAACAVVFKDLNDRPNGTPPFWTRIWDLPRRR